MEKSFFLSAGVVCILGFYSCQKNLGKNSDQLVSESGALSAKPNGGSDIFDPRGLVSPHAKGKLETVGTGFKFTEGPAVDKQGNVFFTDQPDDKIYKWNASSGAITTFLTGTGRANGMAFDKNGGLIACADMYGELRKIHPDGTQEVLVNQHGGKLLNGPNDVWINPANGGMYITDPIFPRGYWEVGDPRIQGWEPTHSEQAATGKGGHVYYLAPGSQTLVRVTTDPNWEADAWPNGVVGSPDGKKLYVNKWYYDNMGGTWVFDINPDGTLTNMQKFVDMGGDGMAADQRGNIYIANGLGVTAFDKKGNKIFFADTKGAGGTNVVFGGADEKTLFITTPNTVFSLRMNIKGVEKY